MDRSTSFLQRIIRVHTSLFQRTVALLLLLYCSAFTKSSNAAEPWITHSWVNNLLNDGGVYSIHIDKNRNLWLGSDYGLYRISGPNLTSFSPFDGADYKIESGYIKNIVSDSNGNIYASTFNSGINRIGGREGEAGYVTSLELPFKGRVENLYVAPDDSLWIIAKGGLFILFSLAGEKQIADLKTDILSEVGSISLMLTLSNSLIFIAGKNGIGLVHTDSMMFRPLSFPHSAINMELGITSALALNSGKLTLGTSHGRILSYDIDSESVFKSQYIPTSTPARISGLCDIDGDLLIATSSGLYYSLKGPSQPLDISKVGQGVSSRDIHSIFCDTGHAWIGTYVGLDLFSKAIFKSPNQPTEQESNDILAIEEDSSGRIWLGAYEGLYLFDPSTGLQQSYSQIPNTIPLAGNRVSALEADDDHLWIGYESQTIQRLNTSSMELSTIATDGNETLYTIDLMVRDDSLWIGTHGNGLVRYNNSKLHSYSETTKLDEPTINLLHTLPDAKLLAVAIDTIYEYDDKDDSFEAIELDFQGLSKAPIILAMKNITDGDVSIGTDSGMYVWDYDSDSENTSLVKVIENSRLLPSPNVGSIELDLHQNLWCSTNNGIARITASGEVMRVFNPSDGLRGNDFATGVSLKSSSGRLYFGGPQGYSYIDPSDIIDHASSSAVVLINANIDGKHESLLSSSSQIDTIAISQGESLTISYGVLDYVDPTKFTYKHRLLLPGEDLDWDYVGKKNSVSFDDLKTGEYRFEVQGSNSAGLWGQSIAAIGIRVVPSPWRTWWAYALYLLGLASAVWTIHRIYYSYLMERHSEALTLQIVETENRAEDEIQEQLELHDELAQSAYRHNRNMLSVLEQCLPETARDSMGDLEKNSRGRKYIRALSLLEDCTLYESGGASVDFHLYVDSVMGEVMQDCPVDTRTIVSVNEVSRTTLSVEVASSLAIIVYELAQNSALHAFSPDSPANYLRVISSMKDNPDSPGATYTLTVRDNGQGLRDDALEKAPSGSGLALAKSIAEQMGANISVSTDNGTAVTVAFAVKDLDEIFA